MKVFVEFKSASEALAYRQQEGCGGWIFAAADGGPAFLFPFAMTPSEVINHPLVANFCGTLL